MGRAEPIRLLPSSDPEDPARGCPARGCLARGRPSHDHPDPANRDDGHDPCLYPWALAGRGRGGVEVASQEWLELQASAHSGPEPPRLAPQARRERSELVREWIQEWAEE